MKKVFLILLVLFVTITWGCSKAEDKDDNTETPIEQENESDNKDSSSDNDTDKTSGIKSPLSGIATEKEKINRRPVAIMFDNHKNARWQAGLSKAEIAYEFLVEGRITRYMGIFLVNDPEVIGPVRSARPYYLSALLEYDPIYVHCGGSPEAMDEIQKLNIADVDCMSAAGYVFYRNNEVGKKAPHNLYTSMESIRKYEKEKGYDKEPQYDTFSFNKERKEIQGEDAKDISIHYDKDNITSYKYDNELNLYIRYKDGEKHIDEDDNTALTATNIIIQEANTKVLDNQGRLEIDSVGSGKGIYITMGKYINITWEKESRDSKTRYFDENGVEIKLNPGITWIQVTLINPELKIS